MNINLKKIEENRNHRLNRINTFSNDKKVSPLAAAMYIDQNAPTTTNKKMLESVDYTFDSVTHDNYKEIIKALGLIGVIVITDNCSDDVDHIVKVLNSVVTEPIPELWGGSDVQEYIDITPVNT